MKNLARGSVILTIASMIVIFFYSETTTEAALVIANDSKGNIQRNTEVSYNENIFENLDNNFGDFDSMIKSSLASSDDKKSGMRTFSATAYCLKGRTASGSGVRRGIVAADPRVLPLGTRINLGAGSYSGSYVVADTGGAIKGRKLDIWVSSCSEARRFGRKTVTVNVGG